jgi:hypothetical protein
MFELDSSFSVSVQCFSTAVCLYQARHCIFCSLIYSDYSFGLSTSDFTTTFDYSFGLSTPDFTTTFDYSFGLSTPDFTTTFDYPFGLSTPDFTTTFDYSFGVFNLFLTPVVLSMT